MIFIIIIIGLILRIINLNQSFWLDEAINIINATNLDYKTLLQNYSLGDFHPPLYHAIIKTWILVVGNSEIATRSLSVIFGTISIIVIFLIAKKLYDEKTALVASVLLATAPLHIYYSQEARMYMLASLLASLSVYFFISILSKEKLIYWIGFITSTALMLYTDYLPYLMIFTYLAYIFFFRKKIRQSTKKGFIPAFILVFITLIPWLILVPKQLSTGLSASAASPAWTQVVGAASIKNFVITFVKFTIGRISNDNNLIYILIFTPIAFYVSLLFLLSAFRLSPKRAFVLFWFFIPLVLGFVISFFIPVYAYFRFIFLLGAFYIILASAINTVNWALPTRILLLIALTINIGSTAIYFINPKFQREDWKGATSHVKSGATQKTLVLFESANSFAPFDYYNQGKIRTLGAFNSFNAQQREVEDALNNNVQNTDKIYLFQYLSGITDPEGLVFRQLTKIGYSNIATRNFNGVGFVYEFKR